MEEFKQQARALMARDVTYAQALQVLARQRGYATYEAARAASAQVGTRRWTGPGVLSGADVPLTGLGRPVSVAVAGTLLPGGGAFWATVRAAVVGEVLHAAADLGGACESLAHPLDGQVPFPVRGECLLTVSPALLPEIGEQLRAAAPGVAGHVGFDPVAWRGVRVRCVTRAQVRAVTLSLRARGVLVRSAR